MLKEASMTSYSDSPPESPMRSLSDADTYESSDKPVKALSGSTLISASNFMQDDDGFLVDLCVRQSYTDKRKTLTLQVLIGRHGSIPPLDPGGGWIQRETYTHVVDVNQLIRLEIWIEAEILLWSPVDSSLVYSNSYNWPEMKIATGTHKVLLITTAELLSGKVVSGKWCGTTADDDLPLDYLEIPGALHVKEIYEDEVADGGREDFRLTATPSNPDEDQGIIAFGNRDIGRVAQHAA